WQPPTGGQNCEKCNSDPLMPCSEYRCKSLGQACEIVNKGTKEESCVWVSKFDVKAPTITLWDESLSPEGLRYIPDNAINPPNQGVKIVKIGAKKGCLEAFTRLKFGIKTDEPAQCRIGFGLEQKLNDLDFPFGDTSLFEKDHIQELKVPDPFAQETGNATSTNFIPEIHNGGTYTLYTRCQDANGNENLGAFAFSYCVDDGPDTRQPEIAGTSILTGSPVRNNIDKVPISVYVNEPAECKWSRQDKAYDAMENVMQCATAPYQVNADLNYVCMGELTGVKNLENNNFFFRCKDMKGNIMTVSSPLVLKGTQDLTIKSSKTTGTKAGGGTNTATVNFEIETANGANNGASTCFLSPEEVVGSEFEMLGSGTPLHNQSLDLVAGNYQYFYRCIDAGGNIAETNTSFAVIADNAAPKITRVLKDGENVKVITDEEAKCAYSTTSCDYVFEQGLPLIYDDPTKRITHTTTWNSDVTYYIKCADLQNNRPRSATCQIVIRGSEF
ncbi:MAG: hypothetical protein AABY05_02845, partial [Nanoarchaeota archaeon]